jgi:hypothetical protein
LCKLFLGADDEFSLRQLGAQPFILTLQPGYLLGGGRRLAATHLGRPGLQLAVGPLAPPLHQVGRIQPFTPEQRTDRTGFATAVDLGQDAQLVLGGEGPALGRRPYFWIRRQQRFGTIRLDTVR